MLKICLVFWESEPQYAYKRYAYKKNMYIMIRLIQKYMKQLWQQQLHRLIYISSSFISNSTQILKARRNSSTDSLYLNKTNVQYRV